MIREIAATVHQMGGHVQHADLRDGTRITFTESFVKLWLSWNVEKSL